MVFRKKTKKAPETVYFEERERPMGEAQEMRDLTQEIADSFDTRVARVAALRQETAAMLKGFREEFRRKAADLRRFLSNGEASRKRDFRAMHQSIRAEQEARSGQVSGMLSGFRRENEAAAGHWRSMTATMERKRASAAR
mgnify:CR=1 FL=1